jgi:hypothetical protein
MLLFLLACKALAPNSLDGSLTESYDLAFDDTRARLASSELAIEYVDDPEGLATVVLRVTLDTEVEPKAGKSYDLVKWGDITQSDATNTTLPDLDEGDVALEEYQDEDGAKVVGSFDASFVTGEGQTLQLQGRFKTELEIQDL